MIHGMIHPLTRCPHGRFDPLGLSRVFGVHRIIYPTYIMSLGWLTPKNSYTSQNLRGITVGPPKKLTFVPRFWGMLTHFLGKRGPLNNQSDIMTLWHHDLWPGCGGGREGQQVWHHDPYFDAETNAQGVAAAIEKYGEGKAPVKCWHFQILSKIYRTLLQRPYLDASFIKKRYRKRHACLHPVTRIYILHRYCYY